MADEPGPQPVGAGSDALLDAYELVLEAIREGGGADDLLRRALAVVATIPWPARHRLFTALVVDEETGALRLAALIGKPADPALQCRGVSPESCVCGEALESGGSVTVTGTARTVRPPCDPDGGGTHFAVPLASREGVLGVLHILLDPGDAPRPAEVSFLGRLASLLGTELQRRRREQEHQNLENRFFQAQKMEAVGRLAGGVAHDFNNILTAITSYSELGLLRLDAASPLRRNFEEILAAADRAALLTQQLLAFSRRQTLAPRLIDLAAVIADMGKMLRRLLGEDVELISRSESGLPRILADPAQVEQVIINLAVNSRDAMPRGGKIVIEATRVRLDAAYAATHPDVAPGEHVCLSFSDTGSGMTRAVRERLFEPFFTTKEQHTGSGLGLAAVYGIVRQSGGHVQVYSEPEVGTTFRVYFPAAAAGQGGPATVVGAAAVPGGTETVLLAEDDDSVRCIMVEYLRDLGYRVLETRNGREALEAAAQAGPIDLLLTDVIMPGMSGRQLHRELAATRPALRVLFVSGYTDEAIVQHGILEPGTELLQKPFSPAMLGDRVRRILDAPPPA